MQIRKFINSAGFGSRKLLAEAERLRKLLEKQLDACDRLEAELSRSEAALEVREQSHAAVDAICLNQSEIRKKLKEARVNIVKSQARADSVAKSALDVLPCAANRISRRLAGSTSRLLRVLHVSSAEIAPTRAIEHRSLSRF